MKRATLYLLLMLAGCASPRTVQEPHAGAAKPAGVLVNVLRKGEGWTADFRFDRAAPAWVFVRSPITPDGGSWRPQSWTIETPGVRLERRGRYDLLVAADGGPMPRRVRIRFRPYGGTVATSYDPALIFSDGSVALFSEQFDAFPLSSADAAGALPADLNRAGVPDSRTRVRFREAGGAVLHAGRRVGSVTVDDDSGSYVLFGPAKPIVSDAMAAVIDPQLPAWIRATLQRSVPEMLGRYAAVLGPPPGPKPTVMVSWAGPTKGTASMSGSVLPGFIAMRYEGEGIQTESPRGREFGLWFIAHEAAHFWLGQAVRYGSPYESWITEGGADLLAVRMVPQVHAGYDVRSKLQTELDDCVKLSAGRGIAKAIERNELRAHYACGVVFALVAEAASGGSFSKFVQRLISEKGTDGEVTRAEWLALLDESSKDPSISRDIGRLLDHGATDPKAAILSLFARASVRHSVSPEGALRML